MFKKINTKLEDLFDQSPQPRINSEQHITEIQKKIQIVDNNKMLENLSYIFSNEINSEGLLNLFSQLCSYFEIGFLMHKTGNSSTYNVIAAFSFMEKMNMIEFFKPIKLPNPGVCKILKTNAHLILSHLGLNNLDPEKKMMSYLLPITNNYTIVVMTQIAEPWAGLKIESLQKTFMKINFSL